MTIEKSASEISYLDSFYKLLLIFVGIYFFELASFPLSIDEEAAALRTSPSVWVKEGRWAAFLVEKFILPRPTIPFLAPAIFGLFASLSYLLFLNVLGIKKLAAREYLLFALYVGFPTWFFIMEFYSNIAATGVGLLCSITAIWILFSSTFIANKFIRLLIAAIPAAVSIGVYQSFLLHLAVAGFGIILVQSIEQERRVILNRIFFTSLLLPLGLIFYKLADYFFRSVLGLINNSEYISSFFKFRLLAENPLLVFKLCIQQMLQVYGVLGNLYGYKLWSAAVLLLATLIFILTRKNFTNIKKLYYIAALAILATIPFSLNLVSGGTIPIRTLVSVPLVIWFSAFIAFKFTSSKLASIFLIVVSSFVIFQSVHINNSFQAAQNFVIKHDFLLASSIQQRLANLEGFNRNKIYPLAVFGGVHFRTNYPRPSTSGIGKSFFEIDGGNARRIVQYMRLHGYINLDLATSNQLDQATATLRKMPVWPRPGSMQIKDGVLLLRLGKKPGRFNLESYARLNYE